ncbi:uncharacterized protein RCO7_01372 [Rhynchosporium graminicola]|uniref:Uncharacterized protein n=1 Tax=Rhynchosporium graminicola TaxID=2792576 RepID=A0A1E1JZC5_9HELO|nr:uncharacterized protein RCO7_01372 [Rhynchosporium commune]
MGCSNSTPFTTASNSAEMRRIRKSQISPSVVIESSPSQSITSIYSNDREEDQRHRYDTSTPPRPPTARGPTASCREKNEDTMRRTTKMIKGRAARPGISFQAPTPTIQRAAKKKNHLSLDCIIPFPFKSSAGTGFSIVHSPSTRPASSASSAGNDLPEEFPLVAPQIGKLIHAIRAYSFLNTQTKSQTLQDLRNLIEALPRPPRAMRCRQLLGTLMDDVGNLYEREKGVWRRAVEGVLVGEKVGKAGYNFDFEDNKRGGERDRGRAKKEVGLEGLWEEFISLRIDEMREMARTLNGACKLMCIFNLLSALRAGSEELLVLDAEISMRLESDFEVVLGELKDFEGTGFTALGMDGGEGEGGLSGVGQIMGESASMQWRVLSIVQGKRKEGLQWRMENVKRGRGEVSVMLLGVVEDLAEGGE